MYKFSPNTLKLIFKVIYRMFITRFEINEVTDEIYDNLEALAGAINDSNRVEYSYNPDTGYIEINNPVTTGNGEEESNSQ